MNKLLTPNRVLVLGFIVFTFIGAILLWLPIAHEPGHPVSFLDALFTAVSAFSVTGLVVVDTATTYSLFGELVILGLIQVGGIGFVTAATFFFILIGKRISMKERLMISEAYNQSSMQGVVRLLLIVISTSLVIEGIGFVLLLVRFIPDWGIATGMYYALFHSISAFNSAGFDLFGIIEPYHSLIKYRYDLWTSAIITIIMVLGALGFIVIYELLQYQPSKKLSLHTKLVLTMTGSLLLIGAVVILLVEWANPATLESLTLKEKVSSAIFHSAARTSGFSTLNVADMYPATLFFIIILMFIGASPGSTGGGIKVTTAIIILLAVWAMVRGKKEVVSFRRTIPNDQVYRALTITVVSVLFVILCTMLLAITERADILTVMFEVASAFGTVGSSMGITPYLTPLGKVIVMICMFVGRLGPLTLGFAIANRKMGKSAIKYPEEKPIIG